MTVHIRRQISIRTAQGLIDSLAEATVFPYRLTDVLPKYVLNIGDGEYTSGEFELNASDSYALPLPESYANTSTLACFIRSNAVCKVVIVDPDLGTSTFILKATSGTTKGDHKGVLMWQGNVTSITVSVPATYDDAFIDFFLWQVPDLTLAASWQIGAQALGVLT